MAPLGALRQQTPLLLRPEFVHKAKKMLLRKKEHNWGNTTTVTQTSVYNITACKQDVRKLPLHTRRNPFPHFSYPLAGVFSAYCPFNISFCFLPALSPRHSTRSRRCWLVEMLSLYHRVKLVSSCSYLVTQMPGIGVLVETSCPLLPASPSDFSFSPKCQTLITLRLFQLVKPISSSSSY